MTIRVWGVLPSSFVIAMIAVFIGHIGVACAMTFAARARLVGRVRACVRVHCSRV